MYDSIKNSIRAAVYTNGTGDITGQALQDLLVDIVDALNGAAQYKGVAIPSTNPGTPAGRTFYLATQAGTYTDFGSLVLDGTKLAVLVWDGSSWTKTELAVPTSSELSTISTALTALTTKMGEGSVYAGIATPATNPGTPTGKVFYLATQAGGYTNFNAISVLDGLTILSYSGGSWTSSVVYTLDNVPKAGSSSPVKSSGIKAEIDDKSVILSMIGKGNTEVYGGLSAALIGGHTYRMYLKNPDFATDTITLPNTYNKFNVFAYNNKSYLKQSDGAQYVQIKMLDTSAQIRDTLNAYYDFEIPTSVGGVTVKEWWACIYGRANSDVEVEIVVEDITYIKSFIDGDYTDDWKLQKMAPLADGEPVRFTFGELGRMFSEETDFADKKINCSQINGKAASAFTTTASTGAKVYNIPLDGLAAADFNQFSTTSRLGSVVMDSSDLAIYGFLHSTDQRSSWKRQFVTSDMSYILFGVTASANDSDEALVLYPTGYNGEMRDIRCKVGAEASFDSPAGEIMEMGFQTKETVSHFNVGDNVLTVIGQAEFQVQGNANLQRTFSVIDVEGYDEVRVKGFRSTSDYPAILLCDASMNVVSRLVNPNGHDIMTEWMYVGTAKYMVYVAMKVGGVIDYYVEYSVGGLVEEVEIHDIKIQSLEEGLAQGSCEGITVKSGQIDSTTGSITPSSEFVVTSAIAGGKGFHMTVNEGYSIYSAHLFDSNGHLVAFNYLPPTDFTSTPYSFLIRQDGTRPFYGSDSIPVGFYIIIMICKMEGGSRVNISASECIIDQFCYLDGGRMSREAVSTPNYQYAQDRIKQLALVRWTPKADIVAANPSSGVPAGNYFFKAGRERFGLPYSEAAEYTKYVGQHVSLYTYLTAIHNKRSLMYTEKIYNGGTSGYGFVYDGLGQNYAASYYGTVCTGLTGYAMGQKNLFVSGAYNNGALPGLTEVTSANAQNVMPLDLIWNSGHCSIIMDVILDERGNRKFIMWAEQTKPTPYITPYTTQMFDDRLAAKSCKVYRYGGWSSLTAPEATPFIQLDWMDYPKDPKYSDNICTFAGDKATFAAGDTIYLNLNRTPGYSTLKIYKDGGAQAIYEIDITNTVTYPNDGMYPDDGEDWVKFNLTTYNLAAGAYEAVLSGTGLDDESTLFEVVDVQLSVAYSDGNVTCTFSSANGAPYLLRQESKTGLAVKDSYYHEITEEEITLGIVTLAWTKQGANDNYMRLYVKGSYGVAVKRVLIAYN